MITAAGTSSGLSLQPQIPSELVSGQGDEAVTGQVIASAILRLLFLPGSDRCLGVGTVRCRYSCLVCGFGLSGHASLMALKGAGTPV
jgi:hypothetical protein